MSNFIFSLNATMPVFLVMLLGYFLKRKGFLTQGFTSVADKVVFKVALPVLLFQDIAKTDLSKDFDWRFAGFCFFSTIIMVAVIWIAAEIFIKDKSQIGSFVQGSFRSSAAVLGIAFAVNIYGDAGMVPVMIIASVPLFNIFSVIVLVRGAENQNLSMGEHIKHTLLQIAKNPIIIGIVAGILFAALHVKFPAMADKTFSLVGSLSTPLALLSIGASFEGEAVLKRKGLVLTGSFIKLLVLPAVFLPIAVMAGFRGESLIALLILFGSPSTVSGYIMAKNMGNDADLSSGIIVLTTIMSAVTITGIIFVMKTVGVI